MIRFWLGVAFAKLSAGRASVVVEVKIAAVRANDGRALTALTDRAMIEQRVNNLAVSQKLLFRFRKLAASVLVGGAPILAAAKSVVSV